MILDLTANNFIIWFCTLSFSSAHACKFGHICYHVCYPIWCLKAGQYRLFGLVKSARNKNCSSDKINNHRECLILLYIENEGRFFFCALLDRRCPDFAYRVTDCFKSCCSRNWLNTCRNCFFEYVWIQICNLEHIMKYFFCEQHVILVQK